MNGNNIIHKTTKRVTGGRESGDLKRINRRGRETPINGEPRKRIADDNGH
jgi:hypothetical protein